MDIFLNVNHTARHRDMYCLQVEKAFKKKFRFFTFFWDHRFYKTYISELVQWKKDFFLLVDSPWSLLQKSTLGVFESHAFFIFCNRSTNGHSSDVGGGKGLWGKVPTCQFAFELGIYISPNQLWNLWIESLRIAAEL